MGVCRICKKATKSEAATIHKACKLLAAKNASEPKADDVAKGFVRKGKLTIGGCGVKSTTLVDSSSSDATTPDAPKTIGSGVNPVVFLDVMVSGELAGRVEIVLRKDVVPKTAENFRCLCTGEKGKNKHGQALCYKNNVIHRIVPKFVCQAGDFTRKDGTGGESIYGPHFADENFTLKHDRAGILSMANSGPHTNSSQFFITLAPSPQLDLQHVAFGHVVKGLEVLKKLEACGTKTGKTLKTVRIGDCGMVDFNKKEITEEEKAAAAAEPPKKETKSSR